MFCNSRDFTCCISVLHISKRPLKGSLGFRSVREWNVSYARGVRNRNIQPKGKTSFHSGVHDPAAASSKTVQLLSSAASFREYGDTCVHRRAPARTREHFTPTTALEFDHHQVPSAFSDPYALSWYLDVSIGTRTPREQSSLASLFRSTAVSGATRFATHGSTFDDIKSEDIVETHKIPSSDFTRR